MCLLHVWEQQRLGQDSLVRAFAARLCNWYQIFSTRVKKHKLCKERDVQKGKSVEGLYRDY